MGTIVYRATKAQAIHDELASVGSYSTVLAHRSLGNRLWFLAEVKTGERAGRKWIGLTLIDCRNGEAAIKSMDETCGPCYYDCPLAFLAQADAPWGRMQGRGASRCAHSTRTAAPSAWRSDRVRAFRTAITPTCCAAASVAADGMSPARATASSSA